MLQAENDARDKDKELSEALERVRLLENVSILRAQWMTPGVVPVGHNEVTCCPCSHDVHGFPKAAVTSRDVPAYRACAVYRKG